MGGGGQKTQIARRRLVGKLCVGSPVSATTAMVVASVEKAIEADFRGMADNPNAGNGNYLRLFAEGRGFRYPA